MASSGADSPAGKGADKAPAGPTEAMIAGVTARLQQGINIEYSTRVRALFEERAPAKTENAVKRLEKVGRKHRWYKKMCSKYGVEAKREFTAEDVSGCAPRAPLPAPCVCGRGWPPGTVGGSPSLRLPALCSGRPSCAA